MKDTIERWLGTVFGLIFVALSLVVTVETIVRKLFNISLQGADELGGYSLAIGATIAFSMALLGRTHIRVDVFHDRLPRRLQNFLNWFSVVCLAAFATLLAWLAWFVVEDSRQYNSVSQTPWATPLSYPQSAWLIGLAIFALVSLAAALRATGLLAAGNIDAMNRDFGPRTAKEDVEEELADIRTRGADALAPVQSAATPGARS